MNYIFWALLAAVCFALSQVINKLLSKHTINNKDSLMAYFMLTTFSFDLFLLPFVPWTLPNLEVIKLLIIITAAFLLGYYCFFAGIFDADASTFAPLFQMQAGLVGLLAFLFLGERFPLQNYAWMALLLGGAILVSFTEKMTPKSFLRKGIVMILLMQVCHAFSNLYVGYALKQISPVQILFWENILIGLIFVVFTLWKKPRLKYKRSHIMPMFVSSYIVGIGVISLFKAFSQNLTLSSIIGLSSAPIVFLISLIASRFSPTFLEHHPLKVYVVRGIGLLIILFGAYKIVTG
jgi:drug/metabolite transporter (DMT)-like permease